VQVPLVQDIPDGKLITLGPGKGLPVLFTVTLNVNGPLAIADGVVTEADDETGDTLYAASYAAMV